jgi:N-acyl-phosphatidylethanolamine-hydrolysing phospholipase D
LVLIRLRQLATIASCLLLLCLSAGGEGRAQPGADVSRAGASVTNRLSRALQGPAGFRNADPEYRRAPIVARATSFVLGGTWLWPEKRVASLAAVPPDLATLRGNRGEATVTWVGHSTVLVQLDGATFLTDPTWAQRTGPFGGLVGIGRYTPPGIRFEDLPPIDFVLISHDHYDHLDEPTVRRLARIHNPRFVVPLGIKSWLADRGIANAVELDWGESTTLKGLTIVCTPAQHGSGRTPFDQGRRLWASWAVLGSKRFYFGGDTGYYRHFKDIGDEFGPFDLAVLPIGSYTPREHTRHVHISPEDALQAWLDLRGARFLGVHWGTFGLAREPYDEPPQRLAAEVERRHLDPGSIWVPPPGQTERW